MASDMYLAIRVDTATLSGDLNKVKTAVNNAADDIKKSGEAAGQGFASGVSSGIGKLPDTIRGARDEFKAAMSDINSAEAVGAGKSRH